MTEQERQRRWTLRQLARQNADVRDRRERWDFPGRVRVVHPRHGEIVVPGRSPLAAIKCAAEKWRVPWAEVTDAQVLALEQKKAAPGDATSESGREKSQGKPPETR